MIAALEQAGITNEQLQQLGIADNIYGLTQSEARKLLGLVNSGRKKKGNPSDSGGDTGNARGLETQQGNRTEANSGAEGRQAEVVESAGSAEDGGYSPLTDESLSDEAREEMQGIMERSKSDGTYMLAPNGSPTNLTERCCIDCLCDRL